MLDGNMSRACTSILAAALAAAAIAWITTPAAWADGDPASDYLLVQNAFLPFDAKIPPAKANQLTQLLANAAKAGFRIRVAVIKTRYDLGSVTVLYNKPHKYAEFLGSEIYFVYRDRLLVVMPNGYGYSKGGKPLPSGPLAGLSAPGQDATELVSSAITAVQRLAAASGVKLSIPRASGGHSTTSDRIKIIAIALTVGALAGSWVLIHRLRASRRRQAA
jgi:hypothetical protein